jgi:LysR family glycine cleavage system transcriptional activator
MSFTLAAEELHVTQAAVSYQVRQLEQVIGVKLFTRLHRNLILTDAARAYLPIVRQALDLLAKGTIQLTRPTFDGVLKISASQSLTPRWLAHRIRRFTSDFPEYDIRIDATDDLVDFVRGEFQTSSPSCYRQTGSFRFAAPSWSVKSGRWKCRSTCRATPCCMMR